LRNASRGSKRPELSDDLDPEAERQLCSMAKEESGVPAVFVLGFPLSARPILYASTYGDDRCRLRRLIQRPGNYNRRSAPALREDLERALISRGIDPSSFDSHLKMFDLGMPPHGGLAIGLERLTAQTLGLQNIREASLYPRDRYRVTP
jgi:nondiscriminating aspartyl-tRNA synthetase